MLRTIAIAALVFMTVLSPFSMAQQKKTISNLQAGNACGEDSTIIATCAAGLSCKGGTCEQNSYLSSETVSCKEEMKKRTGYTGYVAVHDGFCYVNDRCRPMYDAAMSASNVVSKVLTTPNNPKSQKQLVDCSFAC